MSTSVVFPSLDLFRQMKYQLNTFNQNMKFFSWTDFIREVSERFCTFEAYLPATALLCDTVTQAVYINRHSYGCLIHPVVLCCEVYEDNIILLVSLVLTA